MKGGALISGIIYHTNILVIIESCLLLLVRAKFSEISELPTFI